MTTMQKQPTATTRRRSAPAQGLVEYAVLLALLAVGAITALTFVGDQVNGLINSVTASFMGDEAPQPANTNTPPDCSAASASPSELWPPNHQMITVNVNGISDPDGNSVSITITSIYQDEPVNGLGDGDTGPDAAINGSSVSLRAERSGTGNGRVYHLGFSADDGSGGTCSGTLSIGVPKSQGPSGAPVDDGALYDSTTL